MGLNVAEDPPLTPPNETMIEENMVITIHPYVIHPSGVGLIMGDTFIIEADGAKLTSKMGRDFRVL